MRCAIVSTICTVGAVLASFLAGASAQEQLDHTVLPLQEPERPTYRALDVRNVTAPTRFEVPAPEQAPNVVIVLIDDIGFGGPSTFGGPIRTPTLDRLAAALAITSAHAQEAKTPDSVETRIGTLSFEKGYPTPETARKLYDEMDFQRAVQAFLWAFQAVSFESIRVGVKQALGVDYNDLAFARYRMVNWPYCRKWSSKAIASWRSNRAMTAKLTASQ